MYNNICMSEKWYPMRVTYQRELQVKQALDEREVENFLPMRYATVEEPDGGHRRLVPAIHNLIFIHSTQQHISNLKQHTPALEPLRYMTATCLEDQQRNIITVPDKQMDDFIRVASAEEDQVMFLEQSEFLNKEGVKVRVTDGPFAGVEGVIKRIKNNRRVVVSICGVASVAIVFIPAFFLQRIKE